MHGIGAWLSERSGFGLLNRANGIDRLKAHYVAECSKHDDLDTRVSFVPKRGSVKDTLMSTVSDMKADMVILSALTRDGGRATAIATSRIPYVPISSAWLTLDLPLQVILGSMQLSKFKPGGLVIGSLAPNMPHPPHMLVSAHATCTPTPPPPYLHR